jgi:hypothetical protein
MLELRADTVSHSPLGAKLPSVRQEFVCLNCFGNPGLRVWVADNELDSEEYHDPHCDFCKPENSSPVLADLSEVGGYVLECVEARYADPAEELPYETAEGGYQGEVIDAYDVLDCAELDLPNDSTGKLRDLIADHLSEHDWCEKDYFALREDEALRYSWDSYVRVSKEGTVLEFMYGENPGDREEIPPAELLEWLTERAYEFGLVKPLRVGHNLYRVRFQNPGERHRTADELGPPPSYLAKQPNRLNPRHTEMMYASDDAATALAETVVGKGAYAVGEFSVLDELRVLDLTDLPEPICFFDLDNANVRDAVFFLRHFAEQVSLPLVSHANADIEYRPTQIVTQHFRRHLTIEGAHIHGIRYTSSRSKGGVNVGLFGESIVLCDTPPKREKKLIRYPSERSYLQLVRLDEVQR